MPNGIPSPDIAKVNPELLNAAAYKTLGQEKMFVAQAAPDSLERQLIDRAHQMVQDLSEANWLDKMKFGGEVIIDTDAQILAQIDQIKDPGLKAEAQRKYENAKKLASEGNARTDAASKIEFRDKLKARITRDSKLQETFNELRTNNPHLSEDEILDTMLNDPELGKNLGEELTKTPEQHKFDEERYHQAEVQQKAAQERRDAAKQTLEREKAKLKANKAKQKEFDPKEKGSKGEALHDLEGREATLKGNLAHAEETISNAESNLNRLRQERKSAQSDLDRFRSYKGSQAQIESIERQLTEINDSIDTYEQDRLEAVKTKNQCTTDLEKLEKLRSERNLLETTNQTITDNITRYEDELQVAERALTAENEHFELIKRLRKGDEQSFVDSLGHAVSRAIDRTVQAKATRNQKEYLEARDAQQKKMLEEAQKTQDEARKKELEERAIDEKKIVDYMWVRYHPKKGTEAWKRFVEWSRENVLPEGWGGKEKEPFDFITDRRRIENDFDLLFDNPDQATAKILAEELHHDPSGEEIRRYSPLVTREILSNRINTIGKLTKEYQNYMPHLSWYRELAEDGIRFNHQYAEQVRGLLGTNEPLLDENGQPTERAVRAGMKASLLVVLLGGLAQAAGGLASEERR